MATPFTRTRYSRQFGRRLRGASQLWQGLAQLAVGLTHVQRGNPKGAVALLRRGADRIDPYAGESPHGLDVAGLAGHARSLAARIEREGSCAADSLRLRLRS